MYFADFRANFCFFLTKMSFGFYKFLDMFLSLL